MYRTRAHFYSLNTFYSVQQQKIEHRNITEIFIGRRMTFKKNSFSIYLGFQERINLEMFSPDRIFCPRL